MPLSQLTEYELLREPSGCRDLKVGQAQEILRLESEGRKGAVSEVSLRQLPNP